MTFCLSIFSKLSLMTMNRIYNVGFENFTLYYVIFKVSPRSKIQGF